MFTKTVRALAGLAALGLFAAGAASAGDVRSFTPEQASSFASETKAIPGARIFMMHNHGDGAVKVIKVWLPANSDIPPHGGVKEGKMAVATVLTDGLQFAMGDTFDAAKLKPLPAGTMIILTHDNAVHFARTGSKPVELMLVEGLEADFATPLKAK